MAQPFKIWEDAYQVGGGNMSHSYDCSIYLIDCHPDLVLIDSGGGFGFDRLVRNISSLGLDPNNLKALVTTHAHYDHIRCHATFRDHFGVAVIAHELDADAIENGSQARACPVDIRLQGEETSLAYGPHELKLLHIPGHTPGSIVCYVDMAGKRVLFGQDIHGPYSPDWGADPAQARQSLQKLIDYVEADILCEGHFGIYQPASEVRRYIESYLRQL